MSKRNPYNHPTEPKCNFCVIDDVLPLITAYRLREATKNLAYERVDYGNQGTYHAQAKLLNCEYGFIVAKPTLMAVSALLKLDFNAVSTWQPHWFDSVYLAKNQWAQIHTDRTKGNRIAFIYYLNPEWSESDGGVLVLNSYSKPSEQIKVVPKFNRLIALEVTKTSWHHVTKVKHPRKIRHNIVGWLTDKWDGKL